MDARNQVAISTSHANPSGRNFRPIDWIAGGLIVFYWLLQFTHGDAIDIIPADVAFLLYVVPATAFVLAGIVYIVVSSEKINASAATLLIFCALMAGVSVFRSDYRSIFSLGLFGLTLVVIFQVRIIVPIKAVNILFAASGPVTTLMYFGGYSIYTIIPGIGASSDLWWRVSPLPSVAEGAIFATLVFVANLTIKSHKLRSSMMIVSLYFIVLSGSRTAISATLIVLISYFVDKYKIIYSKKSRYALIMAILAGFIFLIYASEIFMSSSIANNSLLKAIVFRDEAVSGANFGEQLGTAAIRRWIFDQHIAAFWESPLVGIGTFDLSMLNSGYGALDNSGTGSEAFVTGILARIGLLSLLVFVPIFLMPQHLSGRDINASLHMRIALFVAMVTYGSFVNAYDFVFFLMIVAVTGGIWAPHDLPESAKLIIRRAYAKS